MKYKEEISRAKQNGYVIVTGIVDGSEFGCEDYEMSHAETINGHYIGNADDAKELCENLGIVPELASPSDAVCSIGYCKKDGKWYGWSHRAICGFGIGSEIKRGYCGYVPVNMEDARLEAIRFWLDVSHINVDAKVIKDDGGLDCFDVSWVYSDDPRIVKNEKLRGTIGGVISYPPEEFGRGEWVASTLEDAKQMAIDFANDVG